MKNLNILQSGGGVYYSSVGNPYSNAALADQKAAAASSKSSKDDGLIPKALLEKLSEKGIPTDVYKFMDMLADFEHKSSFGMGVNKRQLYRLQAYANQIIKQSEYLDAAEKQAEKNGALDEFAVDARGYLYVPDSDGKINKVHASQFDATKHQALTVGELLQQRKFNPNEVDNSSIATTVASNIGIEKINDYIQGILQAVGTSENSSEAYVNLGAIVGKEAARRPNEGQMEALKDLYQLTQQLGPDAIFKVKDQYKSKNMDAAMSYIMSMLPNNIKTQLIARNVANGGKYENSTQYAADIIGTAAMAANNIKMSHGMDYAADINKAAGTAAGEKESGKSYYTSPMEVFWDGDLNKSQDIKIADPSSKNKYGISVPGNVWGTLVDDNGKDVYHVPLSVGLNRGMGKYLDLSKVYIGDKKATAPDLQNIAYENAKIAAVWLPVNGDGEIDWQGFNAYSKAEKEIHDKGITDPQEKARIHSANGSYITYNSKGEMVPLRQTEKYFMTHGYTSGNIVGDSKLNIELKGDQEDAAEDIIDAIYNKSLKTATGISGISGKHWWNKIYITPIFIKASPTASTDARIAAGHGPMDKPHPIQDFMVKQEMMQQPDEPIYATSSQLFTE